MITASSNDHQSFENHTNNRSKSNLQPLEKDTSRKSVWYTLKTLALLLWPKKKLSLQILILVCFAIIAAGRQINYYAPIYNKQIVDSIDISSGTYRWDFVLIHMGFKFLQRGATGGIGLLNNLRSYIWMPIQQYMTRKAELKLFTHLHGLSLRWHLSCKTGEVLNVMNRGTESVNKLLDNILFSIVPTILDIFVVVIFFTKAFSKWLGFIIFTTVILYIVITVVVTTWQKNVQRRKNSADNDQKARCADSLLNFETVKYYGAESIEVGSYEEAIAAYQGEEWKSINALNLLNFSRNVIVSLGLLTGSLLCLHMVVNGEGLTIGDYVFFSTSIIQLYVPLNSFGTYYGTIQQNFVDMENMFDLLKEKQEITDAPDAEPLIVNKGQVEFSNVSFAYTPGKPILKNVSFVVPPGKTVALVGPSGAGKSTIVRLLFRLFEVNSGAIIIDQQNIRCVSQNSLRKSMGVVPQDIVLFNNTVKYNIQYGTLEASEADVIAAAKHAEIHDQILTFPNGYDTKVGERGQKLSGGQKQRVAIARMILKAPMIVLLDEAMGQLDVQTEQKIQGTLDRICADRSTIIIAHRLPAIIHADEILVMRDGEIIQRGRHGDLIAQSGLYLEMWEAQVKSEQKTRGRRRYWSYPPFLESTRMVDN